MRITFGDGTDLDSYALALSGMVGITVDVFLNDDAPINTVKIARTTDDGLVVTNEQDVEVVVPWESIREIMYL